MLIDLHCHTSQKSDDSSIGLREIGELAASQGLDAVCITDHDSFWDADEFRVISDETGILLIPGSEINTDAGHVIVFGLTEYRFGFHRPADLIEAVRSSAGAAVLAHPYRRALPPDVLPETEEWDAALGRALTNPVLDSVDAIEVHNGRGSAIQNRFSSELAVHCNLPCVASSDAHAEADLGKVATATDERITSASDLINALKTGNLHPAELPG